MSASITCECGKSFSIAELELPRPCPNCGRELAQNSQDRWGTDRLEGRFPRRAAGRKLRLTGLALLVLVAVAVVAMLISALLDSIRESAAEKQSLHNLRMIALELHNYNNTMGRLPPAVVYDKEGRPLYSWRVLLLPLLTGQSQNPYEGFNLDEPWDSPNNKQVLARMPKEYALPGRGYPPTDYLTHYQVIDGPTAAFDSGVRLRRVQPSSQGLIPFEISWGGCKYVVYENEKISRIPDTFADGCSCTIMIAEAHEAVPWTSPQDLDYIPDGPLPNLGGLRRNGSFVFAKGDGSGRCIDLRKIRETTLRAVLTASGNDVLSEDLPW